MSRDNIRKYQYSYRHDELLPKFEHSVSLLCWAYNEELLIEDFLIRINTILEKAVHDYEIVVIDDCSVDGTNHIVKNLQKRIPQIKLYRNNKNMNVGYSCRRAIRMATKDYLFWQTIDWSYNIALLRTFLELLTRFDVVAGVRRSPVKIKNRFAKPIAGILKLYGIKHLTKRSDTISKAVVSVINYSLIRVLFNLPLSDYQNVVFYPTGLVQSLTFEANSSFLNPELLIKAYWNGASIVEVPISFISRQAGEAKGTRLKAILTSICDIFKLWFRWVILDKHEIIRKGKITRLNPDEWEAL